MKRKIVIISLILLALILFIPVPKSACDDGGTREFQALTYKIVKWNRMYETDLCYNSTRIYFIPKNFKSVDELWKEIDNGIDNDSSENTVQERKSFGAVATEVFDTYFLAEAEENSSPVEKGMVVSIPKATGDINIDKIKAGDRIIIHYDGIILETYPAQINTIYGIEYPEAQTESKSYVLLIREKSEKKLSDGDSSQITALLDRQTDWEFSYDNINDIELSLNGKSYYYDSESGIVTERDDKAVVLNADDRKELDSIISKYIPAAGKKQEEKNTQGKTIQPENDKIESVSRVVSAYDPNLTIMHNGKKVKPNKEDSKYIKSVIDSFQVSACALFYGKKDYVIYCDSNSFGNSNEIFYDTGEGLLGNSSIGYLTDKDKAKFDTILSEYFNGARQGSTIKAGTDEVITDTFIIKEKNGTDLVMARYDRKNGEYKEGLYSCNYGKLDGNSEMVFNVGDVVTVRYDPEIKETYPMQLTVREIYIAEWNEHFGIMIQK